jgi:hypothetical protein
MEWMEEPDKRRAAIEHALAMTHSDGKSRYVLCLPGWPIEAAPPGPESECKEWVKTSPGGKAVGRVKYYNRTDPKFSGE